MSEQIVKSWDLFHQCFKIGDDVIIITEYDVYHWGKLTHFDDGGCKIKCMTKKEEPFDWDDVIFMSHDGFPCKKMLTSAAGDTLVNELQARKKQNILRQILTMVRYKSRRTDEITLSEDNSINAKALMIGDPFELIGDMGLQLFNPGNFTPYYCIDDTYFETLVMTSSEGLKAVVDFEMKGVIL